MSSATAGDGPQGLGGLGVRIPLGDGHPFRFGISERAVAGDDRNYREADAVGEVPHVLLFVVHPAAVQYDPAHAGAAVVVVQQALEDVVGRVQGHELPGRDDVDRIGVPLPEGDGEPPADHVAQDVVDPEIRLGVAEAGGVQEVEHGEDPASGAADPGFGTAGLDAADAGGSFEDHVVQLAVLLGRGAQVVEHGALGAPLQEEPGGVVLRVAADLDDMLPHGREEVGYVGGDRGFADPALSVDGNLEH